MASNTTTLEKAVKCGVVICSVWLSWQRLFPDIRKSLVSYAHRTAANAQEQTIPADAHNTQMEVDGYFPLTPCVSWEFESTKCWNEYQQAVRDQLTPELNLMLAKSDELYFRSHYPGQIEHLSVERISKQPLRIRCEFLQITDTTWD